MGCRPVLQLFVSIQRLFRLDDSARKLALPREQQAGVGRRETPCRPRCSKDLGLEKFAIIFLAVCPLNAKASRACRAGHASPLLLSMNRQRGSIARTQRRCRNDRPTDSNFDFTAVGVSNDVPKRSHQ